MEKLTKIKHRIIPAKDSQNNSYKKVLEIKGLERGFGNTLAVALRRILLSNITGIAPFCVRIEGVEHEFTALEKVSEDIVTILSNLKKVVLNYDEDYVKDNQIIKLSLNANEDNRITSNHLTVTNAPRVEVQNKDVEIATLSKPGVLKLEMFLRAGRGYVDFEDNKKFIEEKEKELKELSSLSKGAFIAMDSVFSPVVNVAWKVTELNTASLKIEEQLELELETKLGVTPESAIKLACKILVAHFQTIGDLTDLDSDEIFQSEKQSLEKEEDDMEIRLLNISMRSQNALAKSGIKTLNELASYPIEKLKEIKNLGEKSREEIIRKLNEYGKLKN